MRARTLKILAALLAAYALLVLAGTLWPPMENFTGWLVMVPYLSLHVFNRVGIPGLLEHGGNCGWGWCAPSAFGWVFLVLFWVGIAALAAWGLARLTIRRN